MFSFPEYSSEDVCTLAVVLCPLHFPCRGVWLDDAGSLVAEPHLIGPFFYPNSLNFECPDGTNFTFVSIVRMSQYTLLPSIIAILENLH